MDCWEEDQYAGMSHQETPAAPVDSPSPQDGLVAAVEVIAGGPAGLLAEAVAPGQTSLPMGLAILGACAVAVIWAASLEKRQ